MITSTLAHDLRDIDPTISASPRSRLQPWSVTQSGLLSGNMYAISTRHKRKRPFDRTFKCVGEWAIV
jgi:hypothetical protein